MGIEYTGSALRQQSAQVASVLPHPPDNGTDRVQAATKRRGEPERGCVYGTGTEHTGVASRQQPAQGTNGLPASIRRQNGARSDRNRKKRHTGKGRRMRADARTCLQYGNKAYGRAALRQQPSLSANGLPESIGQRDGARSSCNRTKGAHRQGTRDTGRRGNAFAVQDQSIREWRYNGLPTSFGRRNGAHSGYNRAKEAHRENRDARRSGEHLRYGSRAYGRVRSIGGHLQARTAFRNPSDDGTKRAQDAKERRGANGSQASIGQQNGVRAGYNRANRGTGKKR